MLVLASKDEPDNQLGAYDYRLYLSLENRL